MRIILLHSNTNDKPKTVLNICNAHLQLIVTFILTNEMKDERTIQTRKQDKYLIVFYFNNLNILELMQNIN